MALLFILLFKTLFPVSQTSMIYARIFKNSSFIRQVKPKTVQNLYELTKLSINTDIGFALQNIVKLEKQKMSKTLQIKTKILKSFIFLKQKLYKKSIKELLKAKDSITNETNYELKQFIVLQIARINAISENFVNSLKNYQSINKKSKYYRDSLIETVWLLSKYSGDYSNTIDHLDSVVLWYNTKNTSLIPPNDRVLLNIILEKAKTYLKALDLEMAAQTYKEFLKTYAKIKAKYSELPKTTINNNNIKLNQCTGNLKDAAIILFSEKCVKDNLLNVWLKKQEKRSLLDEIQIFNLLESHKLLSPFYKMKYSKLLEKYINSYIETANSRLKGKKLEAKTGILQIRLNLKDIQKEKNKRLLEKNYRKLNRLEKIYDSLLQK